MFERTLCAAALAVLVPGAHVLAATATSIWYCEQIYSNLDGSVQFIVFATDESGQQFLGGQTITASDRAGAASHDYTFPNDLPGDSRNRRFLVATQGFAALGVLAPDYVVPNGFLFLPSGRVTCVGNPYGGHVDASYRQLPPDGDEALAYFPACDFGPGCIFPAVATNYAKRSFAFTPTPPPTTPPSPRSPPVIPPVIPPETPPATPPPGSSEIVKAIEYFHAAFDHYFMTTVPAEEAKLDDPATSGGWKRTGKEFNVYATAADGARPVCRFFSDRFAAKSSHFFSAFGDECAKLEASRDWLLETRTAFYLPSPDGDGRCPAGFAPVYRLYNDGRGGAPSHRFTSAHHARADMIAQHWISEGLGPDGVSMCSPV